jgi:hypothetical protein
MSRDGVAARVADTSAAKTHLATARVEVFVRSASGPRLFREHADQAGLQPNFRVHDREDSAGLTDVCRSNPGQRPN